MRWVGKRTRSPGLSPDPTSEPLVKKLRLGFAEMTATGSQPLWENQWQLEWVCLERVETGIECRNWGIAAGMIAAQVLPGRDLIRILPRGQLSLKARCHAAIFSTSGEGGGRGVCAPPASVRPTQGPHP